MVFQGDGIAVVIASKWRSGKPAAFTRWLERKTQKGRKRRDGKGREWKGTEGMEGKGKEG